MVLTDSHGISRAPCYSGFSLSCFNFRLQDFYLLWCSFQLLRLISTVSFLLSHDPFDQGQRFRLLPFRSPLLRESLLLSFPLATKMFQFARLSLACPWIQQQFERLTYSGISGSTLIFNSPKHFVACYALPRLWVPRYPPQAFCRLNLVVECCATSTCYYMRCGDFINVHNRELNWSRVEVHHYRQIKILP